MAVCLACDMAWYSSAFLHPWGAQGAECARCGAGLDVVPTAPFGEGPLFVPAAWTAGDHQR